MKKILVIILSIICLTMSSCSCYKIDDNIDYTQRRKGTLLYTVEKYKVHDAGVEIWAVSDNGEEYGFFIEHEDIYSYEEPNETTSRVIGVYESRDIYLNYVYYLYFSKDEFKEYIKDRYDIE